LQTKAYGETLKDESNRKPANFRLKWMDQNQSWEKY